MMPSILPQLRVHIWQSTCFVAAAWLLTLALRRNRAAVRYWVWLTASVKFLIPFALLVQLGSQVGTNLTWRTPPEALRQQVSFVVDEVAAPLSLSVPTAVSAEPAAMSSLPASNWIPAALLGVWGFGILIGTLQWLRWWQQMRATTYVATPLQLDLGIEVKSSSGRVEPGVVGIWRPVLLLPDGIADRLTPRQLQAVITHELCHLKRRDNLTAAIHVLVETIFWFHPLVWWIRTRLVEEREQACDEEVLRCGNAPMAYAEGILEVCKHYVESPAFCAAGIGGANLRKRIETIMENHFMRNLGFGKKLMLAAMASLALVTPVTVGIIGALAGRAQSARPVAVESAAPVEVARLPAPALLRPPVFPALLKPPVFPSRPASPELRAAATPALPHFITASIALAQPSPGHSPGTSIASDNITIQATKFTDLIQRAWPVRWYQVVWPAEWSAGGADWSVGVQARYDISATMPPGTSTEDLRLMLQTLFAEHLKMSAHWEERTLPVYALRVSPGGVKFREASDPSSPQARMSLTPAGFEFEPRFPREPIPGPSGMTINNLTEWFSAKYDRRLVDLTELGGVYDIDLFIARDPALAGGWNEQTFFEAMESQLGLRVDQETLSIKMLVIDSLERTPTTTP